MPEQKFSREMRQAIKDDLLDLAEDLICDGSDYGEVVVRGNSLHSLLRKEGG
jgi:hypothetical protein